MYALGTESRSSARASALTNELFLPPVHIKQKREKEKKGKVSLEEKSGGGRNLHIYSMVICSETLADAWNQTDRSTACAVGSRDCGSYSRTSS